MNSSAKGDRLTLHVKHEAQARNLPVLKVRASGHMGNRGGIPADIVVGNWVIECKSYARGLGSGAVEEILTGRQSISAVVHRRDRGMALVSLSLNDFLDLVAKARAAMAAEEA